LRGAPLVTISAKTGRGLDRLHSAILSAHKVWNKRLSTSQCNRWLMDMTDAHPPPAPGGRRIRLRYMTQVKARPPSFVVMCSHPELLPTSYNRYLVNGLREDFSMPGTPIRIFMRSQSDKNPYADKKEKKVTKLNKHQEGRYVKALGRGARKSR
jgi:GTP-binding protein